jgi:hypothetical protein
MGWLTFINSFLVYNQNIIWEIETDGYIRMILKFTLVSVQRNAKSNNWPMMENEPLTGGEASTGVTLTIRNLANMRGSLPTRPKLMRNAVLAVPTVRRIVVIKPPSQAFLLSWAQLSKAPGSTYLYRFIAVMPSRMSIVRLV